MYASLFLFLAFLTTLNAEQAPPVFEQADIKDKIVHLHNQIAQCPSHEKQDLLIQIAVLYAQDQQNEHAFSTFLQALEGTTTRSRVSGSASEEELYQQALTLYLDRHASSPREMAQEIIQRYEAVANAHRDYVHLRYLVAAAYANLGQFEKFFHTFAHSYRVDPDHFIAYKTKAILHAKLFNAAKTAEEREWQRQATLTQLAEAITRYPQDTSLYKMAILSAAEGERPTLLETYLSKIVNENIILPRSDLSFYVQHSIQADQIALAQRFIDKAREWYQYSQVIELAQKRLEQYQKKNTP